MDSSVRTAMMMVAIRGTTPHIQPTRRIRHTRRTQPTPHIRLRRNTPKNPIVPPTTAELWNWQSPPLSIHSPTAA